MSTIKKFLGLLIALTLCFMIFLPIQVSAQLVVGYDGPRLQQDRVALLNLKQFSFLEPANTVPKIFLKTIDGKSNQTWPKNPESIELLPGKHEINLEGFYFPSQPGLRPRYIGEVTVVFNAEAGRNYDLKVNKLKSGNGFLRCELEDVTLNRVVVFPPKPNPKPDTIPKDKAVVCFYREWKLFSGAVDYYVSEKNQDIGLLPNGSLFYHMTNPGSHIYAIGFAGRGKLTHVDLPPGGITYLRASVTDGFLTPVPEVEARKEISGLKSESLAEIQKPTATNVHAPKRNPLPFSLSEIPKDKAVICFYMKGDFTGGTFSILENNQKIETLDNGFYLYHVTTPGSHTYAVGGVRGSGRWMTVNLNPGAIFYLRADFPELKLTSVQEQDAFIEIRDLKISE